eukprot:jgi/Hompol1/5193/HPOL_004213-RA
MFVSKAIDALLSFSHHMTSKDPIILDFLKSRLDKRSVSILELTVQKLELCLKIDKVLTRLLLPNGLFAHTNNLIIESGCMTRFLHVPLLIISSLQVADKKHARGRRDYAAEVFRFETSIVVDNKRAYDSAAQAASEQFEFLNNGDRLTGRRLWELLARAAKQRGAESLVDPVSSTPNRGPSFFFRVPIFLQSSIVVQTPSTSTDTKLDPSEMLSRAPASMGDIPYVDHLAIYDIESVAQPRGVSMSGVSLSPSTPGPGSTGLSGIAAAGAASGGRTPPVSAAGAIPSYLDVSSPGYAHRPHRRFRLARMPDTPPLPLKPNAESANYVLSSTLHADPGENRLSVAFKKNTIIVLTPLSLKAVIQALESLRSEQMDSFAGQFGHIIDIFERRHAASVEPPKEFSFLNFYSLHFSTIHVRLISAIANGRKTTCFVDLLLDSLSASAVMKDWEFVPGQIKLKLNGADCTLRVKESPQYENFQETGQLNDIPSPSAIINAGIARADDDAKLMIVYLRLAWDLVRASHKFDAIREKAPQLLAISENNLTSLCDNILDKWSHKRVAPYPAWFLRLLDPITHAASPAKIQRPLSLGESRLVVSLDSAEVCILDESGESNSIKIEQISILPRVKTTKLSLDHLILPILVVELSAVAQIDSIELSIYPKFIAFVLASLKDWRRRIRAVMSNEQATSMAAQTIPTTPVTATPSTSRQSVMQSQKPATPYTAFSGSPTTPTPEMERTVSMSGILCINRAHAVIQERNVEARLKFDRATLSLQTGHNSLEIASPIPHSLVYSVSAMITHTSLQFCERQQVAPAFASAGSGAAAGHGSSSNILTETILSIDMLDTLATAARTRRQLDDTAIGLTVKHTVVKLPRSLVRIQMFLEKLKTEDIPKYNSVFRDVAFMFPSTDASSGYAGFNAYGTSAATLAVGSSMGNSIGLSESASRFSPKRRMVDIYLNKLTVESDLLSNFRFSYELNQATLSILQYSLSEIESHLMHLYRISKQHVRFITQVQAELDAVPNHGIVQLPTSFSTGSVTRVRDEIVTPWRSLFKGNIVFENIDSKLSIEVVDQLLTTYSVLASVITIEDMHDIQFTKIHALMQPIAIGKIIEVASFWQSALRRRGTARQQELRDMQQSTKAVLESLKFNLGVESDFYPDNHFSQNKVLLPLVTVDITHTPPSNSASTASDAAPSAYTSMDPLQTTKLAINAQIQGFNIELDTSISEKMDLLVQIYERGRQTVMQSFPSVSDANDPATRHLEMVGKTVGRLESVLSGNNASGNNGPEGLDRQTSAPFSVDDAYVSNTVGGDAAAETSASSTNAMILEVTGKFQFAAGTIIVRTLPHAKSSHLHHSPLSEAGSMDSDTMLIPDLTLTASGRTILGSTTHIIEFFEDLVDNLKQHRHHERHQRSQTVMTTRSGSLSSGSHRSHKAAIASIINSKVADQLESEAISQWNAGYTGSGDYQRHSFTFLIRLSQTRINLSCQPYAKVVCALHLEKASLLFSYTPNNAVLQGRRFISCTGNINGLRGSLRHVFSNEDCIRAEIPGISFSGTFDQRIGKGLAFVSTATVPNVSIHVNMRQLQDWFVFQQLWFRHYQHQKSAAGAADHHAGQSHGTPPHASRASTPDTRDHHHRHQASQSPPMSHRATHQDSMSVAILFDRIRVDVEMGPSIGRASLTLRQITGDVEFKWSGGRAISRQLSFAMSGLLFAVEGRLDGSASLDHIKALVATMDPQDSQSGSRGTTGSVSAERAEANFLYQNDRILIVDVQTMAAVIKDTWHESLVQLPVDFVVDSIRFVVSRHAAPRCLQLLRRITASIRDKAMAAKMQLAGATSSSRYRNLANDKPIAVTITVPPRRIFHLAKFSGSVELTLRIRVGMCFGTMTRNNFRDPDCAQLSLSQLDIVFHEVPLILERLSEITRISFAKLSIKKSSLKPVAQSEERMWTGPQWLTFLSASAGSEVLKFPRLTMQLLSESDLLKNRTEYGFRTDFEGRVDVALNLGLYKYLQELVRSYGKAAANLESEQDPELMAAAAAAAAAVTSSASSSSTPDSPRAASPTGSPTFSFGLPPGSMAATGGQSTGASPTSSPPSTPSSQPRRI